MVQEGRFLAIFVARPSRGSGVLGPGRSELYGCCAKTITDPVSDGERFEYPFDPVKPLSQRSIAKDLPLNYERTSSGLNEAYLRIGMLGLLHSPPSLFLLICPGDPPHISKSVHSNDQISSVVRLCPDQCTSCRYFMPSETGRNGFICV